MPTKRELLQTHKWSELTQAEKDRFKDRATFKKRRQKYLDSLEETSTPAANNPFSIPTNIPFTISSGPVYGPTQPVYGPIQTPTSSNNNSSSSTSSNPFAGNTTTYAPGVSTSSPSSNNNRPSSTPTSSNNNRPSPFTTTQEKDPDPVITPDPTDPTPEYEPPPENPAPTPIKPDDPTLFNQIQDLQDQLASQSETFGELEQSYTDDIDLLRGDIRGYQSQIGGFQSQISSLSDQLRDAREKANQFKIRDTQYIGNNNSQGIRLKRSKTFDSGAFAFGTNQLNRNFKSPLSISNINL